MKQMANLLLTATIAMVAVGCEQPGHYKETKETKETTPDKAGDKTTTTTQTKVTK